MMGSMMMAMKKRMGNRMMDEHMDEDGGSDSQPPYHSMTVGEEDEGKENVLPQHGMGPESMAEELADHERDVIENHSHNSPEAMEGEEMLHDKDASKDDDTAHDKELFE